MPEDKQQAPVLPAGASGFTVIVHTWRHGNAALKATLVTSLLLQLIGLSTALLGITDILPFDFYIAGVIAAMLGMGSFLLIGAYWKSIQADATRATYTSLEEKIRENPSEPKLAWDLARIKLENYLDRNLRQVSAIFILILIVMFFGMGLVGVGVWRVIRSPETLAPPAIAAGAGVIVQFIAGTFLVIYRSTMEQAKSYVVVLERINAVGMSINILESIEVARSEIRDNARAQLARDLLGMYGIPERAENA